MKSVYSNYENMSQRGWRRTTGLTQVLDDGTHAYLYGQGRIAQEGAAVDYFLGDALSSVRQLVDNTAEVTLTQSYKPYGNVLISEGNGESVFQYTGEMQNNITNLVYLRSRYYAFGDGRFTSKDVWEGENYSPMTYNQWLYVSGNPINYIDSLGLYKCEDSGDGNCRSIATTLRAKAKNLKLQVSQGSKLPVEAFAELIDDAWHGFEMEPEGFMWGLTNIFLGVDPNIDPQIWKIVGNYNIPQSEFGPNFNWLPYQHSPRSKESNRGDWREEFFDGSSNQAYHFWFFAALTYYESVGHALGGNVLHDPVMLEWICGQDLEKFSRFENNKNEYLHLLYLWHTKAGNTNMEDFRLSLEAIEFGVGIKSEPKSAVTCMAGQCIDQTHSFGTISDPGNWIRTWLKDPEY